MTPTAAPAERRIDDIELLRGIAVLMVLLFHVRLFLIAWPVPWWDNFTTNYCNFWPGVDLFFAISGFVIARTLLPTLRAGLAAGRAQSVAVAFWVRRAWRLLPSAWLWLGLILLQSAIFNRRLALGSVYLNFEATIAGMLSLANFRLAHLVAQEGFAAKAGGSGHYWSLSLEEQFYFLLPLAAMFCGRFLVPVLLAALVVLVAMPPTIGLYYFRAYALILGVLLAVAAEHPAFAAFEPSGLGKSMLGRMAALLLPLTGMSAVAAITQQITPRPIETIAVLAIIPVFVASFGKDYLPLRGIARRAMRWTGQRSYALYLVHVPVFVGTAELWSRLMPAGTRFGPGWEPTFLVTACALVMLLAELNFRIVERPLRRHGALVAGRIWPGTSSDAPVPAAGLDPFAGNYASRCLLTVAALAALFYSWRFAYSHFLSPAWLDFMYWADDFRKWSDGSFTFHDLIKPHFDHRIATTRVFLLADSVFFRMSGYFAGACNLAGLLLLGGWIGALAMRGVDRRSAWYVPPLVFAAFVTGTAQMQNLLQAFQIQFMLTCAAAMAACWYFAAACEPGLPTRGIWVRAAAGFAAVLTASLSMGSAPLLAPALGAMLWLRRAPWQVWTVFAVAALTALSLHSGAHDAQYGLASDRYGALTLPHGLFDPLVLWDRVVFCCNFLASALSAVPRAAPWVGAALYGLLITLVAALARQRRSGQRVPAEDAVLLATALFAALCGPGASLTVRLLLGGPAEALTTRYATMSLLFGAAAAGLALRLLARRYPGGAWIRAGVVLAAGAMLYVVNLPFYAAQAVDLRRSIVAEADLLRNNVGVEGPATMSLAGGIDPWRGTLAFLHRRALNLFAPSAGPPADLLAELAAAPVGSLAHCRGSVDSAMAIDSGAMVLVGWLADPDGRHIAPWVAARDSQGRVLGAARALEDRPDLSAVPGLAPPRFGFRAGFRDDADGPRRVFLAGLFPGAKVPLCELTQAAEVGFVQVLPLAYLNNARAPAQVSVDATRNGWADGPGGAPPRPSGAVAARYFASAGAAAGHINAIDFAVADDGAADAALAVAFWVPANAGGKSVTFVLADGVRLTAPLGPWWHWNVWQAAVLPAAQWRQHGGAARVEIRDSGPGMMTVAAPMLADDPAGWSRLFR